MYHDLFFAPMNRIAIDKPRKGFEFCSDSLSLFDRYSKRRKKYSTSTSTSSCSFNSSLPPPLSVSLNANRAVTGTLRGFDQFMNLVLDGAVDDKMKQDIGMVVRGGVWSFRFSFFFVFFSETSTTSTQKNKTHFLLSLPAKSPSLKKTGHPRQLDRDDHGAGADSGYIEKWRQKKNSTKSCPFFCFPHCKIQSPFRFSFSFFFLCLSASRSRREKEKLISN